MASSTMQALTAKTLSDPITGLPVPATLETHLFLALIRARTSGSHVAVIVADIEDFSSVVTGHGWGAGDEVLRQVAERFRGSLRDDDMVARMFGDVFAGVCEEVASNATLDVIVDRLGRSLARPFTVGEHHLTLNVKIGTAMAQRNDRPEEAIRRAESATR